jgi:hypothetical protein
MEVMQGNFAKGEGSTLLSILLGLSIVRVHLRPLLLEVLLNLHQVHHARSKNTL